MSISALEAFVERENKWSAIFGAKPLSLLNAKDRQTIADKIDSQLSPENLHCDGEISAAQAREKYRFLSRCAEELLSIDPTVKMWEYSQ
jgi:hypothetical protein